MIQNQHISVAVTSIVLALMLPVGHTSLAGDRLAMTDVFVSGTGGFECGERRVACGPHDVLFARAGERHRFVDTTPEFRTWVVFYGPEGGEADQEQQR